MKLRLLAALLFPLFLQANQPDSLNMASDGYGISLKAEKQLGEAVVSVTSVKALSKTAFNAVAIDTRALRNTTKTLADALTKAPGIKLRETGGLGSDLQLTMDGFSGKHIKIFIDGVPQEGVGSAFSLGNIPAGFAERIEVYKGEVPREANRQRHKFNPKSSKRKSSSRTDMRGSQKDRKNLCEPPCFSS